MIYIKKIINNDLERTPTFNKESILDFFKIKLDHGENIELDIKLLQNNFDYKIKFQKRNTRDEYRIFLNELFNTINPKEEDILIFRKNGKSYTCEHVPKNTDAYSHLDHLFERDSNHELIIEDDQTETVSNNNLKDNFANWFTKVDSSKHNYFQDSFNSNRDSLIRALSEYEDVYNEEFNSLVFNFSADNTKEHLNTLKKNLYKDSGKFYEFSQKKSNHMPRAILGNSNFLKFLSDEIIKNKFANQDPTRIKPLGNQKKFDISDFQNSCKNAGLVYSDKLITRFVSSLLTKPFVILTGLSGSGKTKLAQAFAQWITADQSQYSIVPVGADWTNREPLLGYPNALNKEEYISPENGVLDLMIRAKQNINNTNEATKPYFLILDEMNLSHVERYFADFLSTMESGDKIPLHKIENASLIVPSAIKLPKNLFIIGTVNIDETTYMFSPKVLDRANTIEFRLTEKDLEDFIASEIKLDMDILTAQGANMGQSFMSMALLETEKNLKTVEDDLKLFFSELKKSGAEFGYRTASEIGRLMYMLEELGEEGENLLDLAIMQKLLPKLHGSRNKLTKVLPVLGGFCLTDKSNIKKEYLDKYLSNNLTEKELKSDINVKYKVSFEKICRIYKNAVENGFASYAEA